MGNIAYTFKIELSGNDSLSSREFTPDLLRTDFLSGSFKELTAFQAPVVHSFEATDGALTGLFPNLSSANNLGNLQYINIRSNGLSGEITGTNQLSSLVSLNIYNNNLTNINAALSSPSLTHVEASYNQLSGVFQPPKTRRLVRLHVQHNRLTHIADFPSASPLPSASPIPLSIDFSFNRLSTVPSFAALNLRSLKLGNNSLSAFPKLPGIPDPWYFNLAFFSAPFNKITGSIPMGYMVSSQLTDFIVNDNLITGNIPPPRSDCPYLSAYDVSNNQLSGEIPHLFQGTNLVYFNASNNNLQGAVPILRTLKNLAVFNVSKNVGLTALRDWSLEPLETSNLQQFDVSNCRISDPIPSLNGVSNLRNFNISNNSFFGELSSVSQSFQTPCPLLSVLNIAHNANITFTSGCILALSELVEFNANSCRRGSSLNTSTASPLPSTLSCFPKIKIINISSNNISGYLPRDFEQASTLERFSVGTNAFSGINSFGPVTSSLGHFDVSNNRFDRVTLSQIVTSFATAGRKEGFLNIAGNYVAGRIQLLDTTTGCRKLSSASPERPALSAWPMKTLTQLPGSYTVTARISSHGLVPGQIITLSNWDLYCADFIQFNVPGESEPWDCKLYTTKVEAVLNANQFTFKAPIRRTTCSIYSNAQNTIAKILTPLSSSNVSNCPLAAYQSLKLPVASGGLGWYVNANL